MNLAKLRKTIMKQPRMFTGIGLAILVIIVGVVMLSLPEGELTKNGTSSVSGAADTGALKEPAYETLLPKGKTIEVLGGWALVSPPESDPVFAFADKIGEVHITVSQQPLPERFRQNPADEVAKLAEQFNASERLEVRQATAYLGIAKSGQQSVILASDNLLILIKSAAKISNADWTTYINSLN